MPYCPKCGNHYYEGTEVCSCGQQLAKPNNDIGVKSTSIRIFHQEKSCPYCRATGKIEAGVGGKATIICPICHGLRYNLIPQDWITCEECQGDGVSIYSSLSTGREPCPQCKGSGWKNRSL
jgi:DnaJ-class molecular chaperone